MRWVVVLVLVRYCRFFFGWLWLVVFVVPSSAGLVKLHTVVSVKRLSEKLKQMVIHSDKKIPAYGASARSSTLLNFCGINNRHISVVIDKNPMKNGLMTAGSNIPIVSLEEGLEEIKTSEKILLLAWNFRDEIIQELRRAGFSGKFIVPLPGDPYII